ncbi:methyltransferase domain-containing protein [Marinifilum sp. JC120]|nr:methyltransferase domain-containing protein [Marinifilum sp. JC120]
MNCRHCNTPLNHGFANLYHQPVSNAFLTGEQLNEPEIYYPLHVYVCEKCFLVQVAEHKKSVEIFKDDYVYFSSTSSSWVEHARKYVAMVQKRFGLDADSLVVEIASNDGYLLQHCVESGVPCMGIEPASNTACIAEAKGIPCLKEFFTSALADKLVKEGKRADLLLGNNVLAHVPDINDFVRGVKILLSTRGVVTMEFPHLMELVANNQFDTIYQEHYSYLSFFTVSQIFEMHGLYIFDVEQLSTHGGSLRIFASHKDGDEYKETPAVSRMLKSEKQAGMQDLGYYENFQHQIEEAKNNLLYFLLEQKKQGKTVAAYGAAAKGNTLLNTCGVKSDLISFCVDKAASKQGMYMPGSHIPVYEPVHLRDQKPDVVLILPWNIAGEIKCEHHYISEWGGVFVTAIPELHIHSNNCSK